MIINHGMLPFVEPHSFLFITNPKDKKEVVGFYRAQNWWVDAKCNLPCAKNSEFACNEIPLEFSDGLVFKAESKNQTFVLKGGYWQKEFGRLQGNDEGFHYPLVTTSCAELPAGTVLYRCIGIGRWEKHLLLKSGEWDTGKEAVFCKKRVMCKMKLPKEVGDGDTLTTSDGSQRIQYSVREGWLHRNTVHRGTACAH
jgi:hypothetical protein